MERKIAQQRFHSQKGNAKRRGIEWRLTFEQWLEWWGDDLDNRGPKAWNLQMQRVADSGAYELGNIRKGRPKDNSHTYSVCLQNRRTVAAKIAHEAALDASCAEPTDIEEPEDESISAYMSRDRNDVVIRRCKADVIGGRRWS